MKKIKLLFAAVLAGTVANAQAIESEVFLGQGYANQAYYQLASGEVLQNAKADWDLAFEASGFGSGIRINGANGVKLWVYPNGDNSAWQNVDTAGIATWKQHFDSDTSWAFGAFNRSRNFNNPFDLGWGVYNTMTHAVTGDSLHILQLADGSFRKLQMINLLGGSFNFKYAHLDGSNEETVAIAKSDFNDKNFGYYSILNQETLDLEPPANNWDLLLTQYIAEIAPNVHHNVAGVLMNNGVEAARVLDVADVTNYNDWQNKPFSHWINTIGYDWKSLNYQTFQFEIADSLLFFIADRAGDIWRLYFSSFGGSATGKYGFTKEKLGSTANIDELTSSNAPSLIVYPNPSNGSNIHLLYNNTQQGSVSLTLMDYTGKIVNQSNLKHLSGLTDFDISGLQLRKGVYMVSLQHENGSVVNQRLIVQ